MLRRRQARVEFGRAGMSRLTGIRPEFVRFSSLFLLRNGLNPASRRHSRRSARQRIEVKRPNREGVGVAGQLRQSRKFGGRPYWLARNAGRMNLFSLEFQRRYPGSSDSLSRHGWTLALQFLKLRTIPVSAPSGGRASGEPRRKEKMNGGARSAASERGSLHKIRQTIAVWRMA